MRYELASGKLKLVEQMNVSRNVVDEFYVSGMAIQRFFKSGKNRSHDLFIKGVEEEANRRLQGNHVFRCIDVHRLYVETTPIAASISSNILQGCGMQIQRIFNADYLLEWIMRRKKKSPSLAGAKIQKDIVFVPHRRAPEQSLKRSHWHGFVGMAVLSVGALNLEIFNGNSAGSVRPMNFVKGAGRFVFCH